jgi:hypothetical protein
MPTTWTAQKIHFLTQPELRALFRVMTRKRDRALFLLLTFTLRSLQLCSKTAGFRASLVNQFC